MRKLIKYYAKLIKALCEADHTIDFQIAVVSIAMFVLGVVLWECGA